MWQSPSPSRTRRLPQTIPPVKGVLLWLSLTAMLVVVIVLLALSFHQRVVPSHTHDPHPAGGASTDVFWADSERLKLSGPYDYVSTPFTPTYSATYLGRWTCYPSALTNTPSYALTIIVTDGRTHVEQSALIECNELDQQAGALPLNLTGADPYTVTVQSGGPWTLSIGRS